MGRRLTIRRRRRQPRGARSIRWGDRRIAARRILLLARDNPHLRILNFGLFWPSTATGHSLSWWVSRDVFRAPWEALSNAGGSGAVGLPCSSRRRVQASRPARRVAQGTGLARRRPRGGLFFGYFLLATQKKVRPPARRKTAHQENRPRVGRGTRRLRRPEPSVRHGTPTRIILYHVPRETPSSVFPPRRSARRARRRRRFRPIRRGRSVPCGRRR